RLVNRGIRLVDLLLREPLADRAAFFKEGTLAVEQGLLKRPERAVQVTQPRHVLAVLPLLFEALLAHRAKEAGEGRCGTSYYPRSRGGERQPRHVFAGRLSGPEVLKLRETVEGFDATLGDGPYFVRDDAQSVGQAEHLAAKPGHFPERLGEP